MKLITALLVFTLTAFAGAAETFPTGQDTPEGVACDLARAFINADSALWKKITIRRYSPKDSKSDKEYATFLDEIAGQMNEQAKKAPAERDGPRKLEKCYEARHLSREGPANYGATIFGFKDLMFVDTVVRVSDGSEFKNRALVIKDKDGKWYVHPMPSVSPLLCAGLNEESPSVSEFREKSAK